MSETTAVRTVMVSNPEGLHVRPCDLIAKAARKFASQVEIVNGSERADAKSILSLLTVVASAQCGAQLTLEAVGADAESAVSAVAELFAKNFSGE